MTDYRCCSVAPPAAAYGTSRRSSRGEECTVQIRAVQYSTEVHMHAVGLRGFWTGTSSVLVWKSGGRGRRGRSACSGRLAARVGTGCPAFGALCAFEIPAVWGWVPHVRHVTSSLLASHLFVLSAWRAKGWAEAKGKRLMHAGWLWLFMALARRCDALDV